MHWPDNFNFEEDQLCQEVFKPFILGQMKELEVYNAQRSSVTGGEHTYIFHEHAMRVAENVKRTCLHMGLGKIVATNLYWAVLPHDIGKKMLPAEIWDQEEKPSGAIKKFRRTHTLLGGQIAEEMLANYDHPFKELMIDIMRYHHEQMDGEGTHGMPGTELSLPVRLCAIIEAYDGWRIWRPHFADRDISPPAVLKRIREEKGEQIFDMELFESFAEMKMLDYKEGRILQDN